MFYINNLIKMGCLEEGGCDCDKDKTKEDDNIQKIHSLGRSRTNAEDFDLESYKINMLKLHNDKRKNHNSPELKLNEDLNIIASDYAESLVNKNAKNILNKYKGEIVGENIIISESRKPEVILNKVFNEEKNYNYNENKFSKNSGHFTQMIWKSTTDIGFGFWDDKENNKYYNVILYYPAGNILGKFKQNVIGEK